MKKQIISCVALIIAVGLMTACTTAQRKDTGMVAGGVIGGVAGGAVAGTGGAIVGAVGGGYVGRQLTN
jgi:osmotically inducible lipoprotein OsmB